MTPGIVVAARRWLFAIVFLAALLRFYPIWFGLPFAHARPDETTTLLPPLCLSAAVAVDDVASWIARHASIRPARATLALALVVAGPTVVNSLWFDILLSRTDSRVLAARWLTPRLRAGDTLYDNGDAYAELNLTPAAVHHWQHAATSGGFVNASGLTPDRLVLHESPINVPTPAPLVSLGRTSYDLVFTVIASTAAAESSLYYRQDAFFMPISGFSSIERPGPTIRVYRRRDAPPLPSTGSARADTSR
jgi:hypothetical protein